jgi:hypothetical protein
MVRRLIHSGYEEQVGGQRARGGSNFVDLRAPLAFRSRTLRFSGPFLSADGA